MQLGVPEGQHTLACPCPLSHSAGSCRQTPASGRYINGLSVVQVRTLFHTRKRGLWRHTAVVCVRISMVHGYVTSLGKDMQHEYAQGNATMLSQGGFMRVMAQCVLLAPQLLATLCHMPTLCAPSAQAAGKHKHSHNRLNPSSNH